MGGRDEPGMSSSTVSRRVQTGTRRKRRKTAASPVVVMRYGLVSLLLAGPGVVLSARVYGSHSRRTGDEDGRLSGDQPFLPSDRLCAASEDESLCACMDVHRGDSETGEPPEPMELAATVSQRRPTLRVECFPAYATPYPVGRVCPMESNGLINCSDIPSDDNTKMAPISIESLLSPGERKVSWSKAGRTSDRGESLVLTVPHERFPLVEKYFSVGCKGRESDDTLCDVVVTLQPKATMTWDNIVTCAYGRTSNEKRQRVILTPEKNSVTIDCGEPGAMIPPNYTDNCYTYNKELSDENLLQFSEILPGYTKAWWSHDTANPHMFTFTIPRDKFPFDARKFALGCTTVGFSYGSTSVCSVDIKVKAASLGGGSGTGTGGGASTERWEPQPTRICQPGHFCCDRQRSICCRCGFRFSWLRGRELDCLDKA